MTELAALGLSADSKGVVKATGDLDKLTVAAERAEKSADGLAKGTDRLRDANGRFIPKAQLAAEAVRKVGGESRTTMGALERMALAARGGVSDAMHKMAAAAGGATGQLVAMAAAAFGIQRIVSTISDFEKASSRMGAISRATAGDLERMRDVAKQLGATTEFTATQAADGLAYLAMAGFNASEAVAAMPAILDLATASGMDLASAADTASNIMSGFGIAAQNSASVADVLAAASSRANTNVSQLGQAMSTVAPISAALGISLEDTASAIGVMSDAGIQGERAGTALRGVLASLAGPTDTALDALDKYGLKARDIDPKINGLANVMDKLNAAGISTADAMEIFGREAASGALVMIKSSDRVREFGQELRTVSGAAGEMADQIRDNLGGDLQTLGSAVSALILALGEAGLTAILRGLTQGVTMLVGAITSVVDLIGLVTGNFEALSIIALALGATQIPALAASLVAAGVGATAMSVGSVAATTAVSAMGLAATAGAAAVGIFNAAVSFLGGPIGVAIGLAVAGIGTAYALMGGKAEKADDFVADLNGTLNKVPGYGEGANSGARVAASGFKVAGDAASTAEGQINSMLSAYGKFVALDPSAGRMTVGGGGGAAEIEAFLGGVGMPLREAGADDIRPNRAPNGIGGVDWGTPPSTRSSGGGGGGGGGGSDQYASNLQNLVESLATERATTDAWYESSMSILNDRRAQEILGLETFNATKEALEKEHADRIRSIEMAQQDERLGYTSSFFGAMAGLVAAGGGKMAKAAATFGAVEATINAYRAAAQAAADPTVPFWGKAAAYASAFGTVIQSVRAIKQAGGGGGGGSAGAASGGAQSASRTSTQEGPLRVSADAFDPSKLYTGEAVQKWFNAMQGEAKNRGIEWVPS